MFAVFAAASAALALFGAAMLAASKLMDFADRFDSRRRHEV